MGAMVGLLFGVGMLMVLSSFRPRAEAPTRRRRKDHRLADMLSQAGVQSVTPAALVGACVATGLCAAVVMYVVSRSAVLALAFGLLGSWFPFSVVRFRLRRRRTELRELWPEVVDNLASAVRAGMSLPESVSQIGERGPVELRAPFRSFGEDYRATGRYDTSLDRLRETLADPVGDRVVEALRMARDVGGTDLGRLLRTLSAFLREDARTRSEIEARQSWTINGARLAVAAPWVVLAMLSLRPEAVAAYDSAAGMIVLAVGAAVSVTAYRVMMQIGRLPPERRVLL